MDKKVSEFFESLRGKTIAVCGLGKSNSSVIDLFVKYGATVIICDKDEKIRETPIFDQFAKQGIMFSLGKHYLSKVKADMIFRAPGVPFYDEELMKAKERGIVITSEIEVFFDLCPSKIFAVTGSDGKTTTSTIVYELLKSAGYKTYLGGNIGDPLLYRIEAMKSTDMVVAELSSFQLISMRRSPDVSIVTNLSPNHLDVHKDMQEYIDAKKNIVSHQNAFSATVLNYDNPIAKEFSHIIRGKELYFSRKQPVSHGTYVDENNIVCYAFNDEITKLIKASEIKIRGLHNLENYLAAIAATFDYIQPKDVENVAKNFGGVEHRIEFVTNVDGASYYNDSIASSPTRTISGTLSLFNKKIILIAGGYDKKIPYDKLGEVIPQKVKLLILMGDTADTIEEAVEKSEFYNPEELEIIKVENMRQAVRIAHEKAVEEDIVCLSPASASFGMYKNFEQRGNHFKELVNELCKRTQRE